MKKVLAGMRPTGPLHLGNYFGALKNFVEMQNSTDYDTTFFIADWHALTTNYEDPQDIKGNVREVLLDYLACGISTEKSRVFIQSHNPYHAELFLILSMVTPITWLERTPSYKELRENIANKDLSNYGFLGYPVLQTADIVLYDADLVPIGVDQAPHLEISREIVRRFNHLYNTDVLKEPQAMLSESSKLLGTDGRKMSKSYGNVIMLKQDINQVKKMLKTMKTDESRQRRTDAGNPDICPVYDYHKLFSTDAELAECATGCRSASIGCIDCKNILIPHIVAFLEGIQSKRKVLEAEISDPYEFLAPHSTTSTEQAGRRVDSVRRAMGI